MTDTIERKRLVILKILRDANGPVGSMAITEKLKSSGYDISERTVRFHLLAMDKMGLTEYIDRHGRRITDKGRTELANARVIDKVGFLAGKIDEMTYRMSFDLARREGTVVVNVSLIKREELEASVPLMERVFQAGYAMGRLITLYGPGEAAGELLVPDGQVGIGTVCSITVNGALLAHGIPTFSRFGGLIEIEDRKPTRFVAIINYDGTSLDPLEIFIKSGMTDYLGATENGNGRIGASFREIPAASRQRVMELAGKLTEVGLGGFMEIGMPGQPLMEIPIEESRIGAVVIGGLNPVAILEEKGIRAQSRALSGLADFQRFFHFSELETRIKDL
jgi:repressor of nif and glnA expression